MDNQETAFIDVRDLGLKTPEGPVYQHANFTIEQGQVCALFGDEGCGKTSLLLTLGGRMKFKDGQAKVAGFDLKKQYKKVRNLSGISVIERVNDVPKFLLVKDILSAELSMAGRPGNTQGVTDYLEEWDFVRCMNVPYNRLDAYDRYLFEIMLAATTVPQLLLVDEISRGMTQHDSLNMIELFRRLWQKKNITTVFCTNEFEIARNADCMIIASEGAEVQRERVLAKTKDAGTARIVGTVNGVEAKDGPFYPVANLEDMEVR